MVVACFVLIISVFRLLEIQQRLEVRFSLRNLAMVVFCLACFINFSFSIFQIVFPFGWHCSIDLLVRFSNSKFFFQFCELYFRCCLVVFFFCLRPITLMKSNFGGNSSSLLNFKRFLPKVVQLHGYFFTCDVTQFPYSTAISKVKLASHEENKLLTREKILTPLLSNFMVFEYFFNISVNFFYYGIIFVITAYFWQNNIIKAIADSFLPRLRCPPYVQTVPKGKCQCPDFRAFARVWCFHVQTFLRSCTDFRAFTNSSFNRSVTSFIHIQKFAAIILAAKVELICKILQILVVD